MKSTAQALYSTLQAWAQSFLLTCSVCVTVHPHLQSDGKCVETFQPNPTQKLLAITNVLSKHLSFGFMTLASIRKRVYFHVLTEFCLQGNKKGQNGTEGKNGELCFEGSSNTTATSPIKNDFGTFQMWLVKFLI